MSRPDKFRAFGSNWGIEYYEENGDPSFSGLTEYSTHKVKCMNQLEERVKKTLLHELIHVAEHHTNAMITEEQVVRLEHGLWALMRDNPDMWRWIITEDGEVPEPPAQAPAKKRVAR